MKQENSAAPGYREFMLPVLGIVFIGVIWLSLCLGVHSIPVPRVGRLLFDLIWPGNLPSTPVWTEKERIIVQSVRLPRIILAALVGSGLGLCGASLQGLMRNPLVGPDLVGVAAGAACGGVVGILWSLPPTGVVAAAFAGGILAFICATGLARLAGSGGLIAIVLAGVVVGSLFSAIVAMAQYVADPDNKLPSMVYWLMGSFAGASSQRVWTLFIPWLLASTGILLLRWRINLLSLGEVDAASLGVPVGALRWTIIALVSLLIAAQVSVSGMIGWVGLVVPHFARMLVGPDHRRLLPASVLAGGIFMVVVDDLARSLTFQELPVGLLTSLVGTPVFALVFWKTQAKGWSHE